jgi:hypothetical protein
MEKEDLALRHATEAGPKICSTALPSWLRVIREQARSMVVSLAEPKITDPLVLFTPGDSRQGDRAILHIADAQPELVSWPPIARRAEQRLPRRGQDSCALGSRW